MALVMMVDWLGLWAVFVLDGVALAVRFPLLGVETRMHSAAADGPARLGRFKGVRSFSSSSLLGGKETVRRASRLSVSCSTELAFLLRDELGAGISTTTAVFAVASGNVCVLATRVKLVMGLAEGTDSTACRLLIAGRGILQSRGKCVDSFARLRERSVAVGTGVQGSCEAE